MQNKPKKLRVCIGPHCRYRGSERIMEILEEHFKMKKGEPDREVDLNFCNCTDNCDFGPNVVEDDEYIYTESRTRDIAERIEKGDKKKISRILLGDLNLDEDLLL